MIKKSAVWAVLLSALSFVSFANAQLKYKAGTDYIVLEEPIAQYDEPTIIEFFWFGCPICNSLREPVHQWEKNGKPADVKFEAIHAVIGSPSWDLPAQAYYTMKQLNLPLEDKYFDAYFKGNRGLLLKKEAIREFFLQNSEISAEQFEKAWNSFEVKQQLQRSKTLFEKANLEGTPAFIVNGKYVVMYQRDQNRLFDILNTLSKK